MDLKHLMNRLSHYKRINKPSKDPYDKGRHTYCNLVYLDEVTGKAHFFEVRSWKYDMLNDVLDIYIVNWTMMAGTGSLHLKNIPEEINKWKIVEDHPTLQVLYGFGK